MLLLLQPDDTVWPLLDYLLMDHKRCQGRVWVWLAPSDTVGAGVRLGHWISLSDEQMENWPSLLGPCGVTTLSGILPPMPSHILSGWTRAPQPP